MGVVLQGVAPSITWKEMAYNIYVATGYEMSIELYLEIDLYNPGS